MRDEVTGLKLVCYMSYVPGQNDAGEVAKVNNSSQTP